MTFEETLEYLYTRLPMYQRIGKTAYKKDLTNTIKLLKYLDNPHQKFKSIHIAGTNGKGTSAHAIAAIFQEAGYKTGLYTSPHLKNFTERIRINGSEIPKEYVADFVSRVKLAIEQIEPSFFEITVALAFEYFAAEAIDIAIVETGLGGRLDSTNVITPEACLITNIGYDHMDILGNTLPEIAGEKAGIIKQEVPVIVGEYQKDTWTVFDKIAEERKAPLILAESTEWNTDSLVPHYLKLNYPGIYSLVAEMRRQGWKVSQEHVKSGMNHLNELTGLKGRFQILSEEPLTIADVSHNESGLKILFNQVSESCVGQLHLIFGTVKDKKLEPLFACFPKQAKVYWTESKVPRSLSVEELAIQGVMNSIEGECFKDVNEALNQAKTKVLPEDTILITGSTFVIAEIDEL